MKRFVFIVAITSLFLPLAAQDQPTRPKITGIAHVRLYASSIDDSRAFYSKILGLPAAGGGCVGVSHPCFPVNWYQQIELVKAPASLSSNFLAEVAFATDNVAQMRRYLLAHNLKPGTISKDPNGDQHFELVDPEGHPLAFVQSPLTLADYEISVNQISSRLLHAGFVVKDLELMKKFYLDLLGFRLYWYGGFKDVDRSAVAPNGDRSAVAPNGDRSAVAPNGDRSAVASDNDIDWYEIQVPDGDNWVEFMLNIPANADHKELGVQNHFSLGVEKIAPAAAKLRANGASSFDGPEIGRDGKQGLDIYDPDASRVEFMEFTPAKAPCCHPYTAPHAKP